MVLGKEIKEWIDDFPLLDDIIDKKEVFFKNPKYTLRHSKSKI